MSFPVPANEAERLEALRSYGILDTPPEVAFDELTELAAEICGCPAAYISLIDDTRQWLKALARLPATLCESPRDVAICSHTIAQDDVFVVPDLALDERFWQFPLVTNPPYLRFYCGAPLINKDRYALGSLCAVDFVPRDLDESKREAMRRLANQVVAQLELRRSMTTLNTTQGQLEAEKGRSEELLLNILPARVATELKERGGVVEPQFYQSATILFTDFHSFTTLAEGLAPWQLIDTLDQYFSAFDEISQRHRLEKLKTVGDSYMCAGGLPDENRTHVFDSCLAALEMQAFVTRMNRERRKLRLPVWDMRIGINTGFVMAGVVGRRKFTYDVWGNTVNVASRMESSGEEGRTNISEAVWDRVKNLFECEPRGFIEAKNKGKLAMYFLNRIKPEFSADAEGIVPNERFWLAAQANGAPAETVAHAG
jgi:class 3 adenylate cyclase